MAVKNYKRIILEDIGIDYTKIPAWQTETTFKPTFSILFGRSPDDKYIPLKTFSDGSLAVLDQSKSEIYVQDPQYTLKELTININDKIDLTTTTTNTLTYSVSYSLGVESNILIDHAVVNKALTVLAYCSNYVGSISIESINTYLQCLDANSNIKANIMLPIERPFRVDKVATINFIVKVAIPYDPTQFATGDYLYISGNVITQFRYKTI